MVLSSCSQGSGGQGAGSCMACEEPVGDFLEHFYLEEAEEDALGRTAIM